MVLWAQYTPLLPAVATGTIEDRSIVEPVRRIVKDKVCNVPPVTTPPVMMLHVSQ